MSEHTKIGGLSLDYVERELDRMAACLVTERPCPKCQKEAEILKGWARKVTKSATTPKEQLEARRGK